MLGGDCSPCCAQGCSSSDIQLFWERMSSASVHLTVSGTSDERNAVTVVEGAYALGTANGSYWGTAAVYKGTNSPVGVRAMAFVPDLSFNVSGWAAQVTYEWYGDGIEARLTFILSQDSAFTRSNLLPRSLSNVLWQGGSDCFGRAWLYIKQNAEERYYAADSSLGPRNENTTTVNGLTSTVRWYASDYASGTAFGAFAQRQSLSGLWLGDRYAQSAATYQQQTYTRTYYDITTFSDQHAWQVTATDNASGLVLSFPQDSRSNYVLPSFRPGPSPWLLAPQAPQRVGFSNGYTVAGSPQQDTNEFLPHFIASSSITPSVQITYT